MTVYANDTLEANIAHQNVIEKFYLILQGSISVSG
jgi:hypothetical protein